jgi:uncharacterized protein YndB with AHSA1/START domain
MEKIIITTQITIHRPVGVVWDYYTKPEHVVNWNFASDDWHCPEAKNDVREGGTFSYIMAAKDGSFSFDFCGTYNVVIENTTLEITLGDERKVWIEFSDNNQKTTIIQKFEAENENSPELQKTGWQMILENFKKYVESK